MSEKEGEGLSCESGPWFDQVKGVTYFDPELICPDEQIKEQRRYEVAKDLFIHYRFTDGENYEASAKEAMIGADIFLDALYGGE